MSSNKGELSQLITFPAKPRSEKGSLKWCETPRAISGREGRREGSNLASLHGSQGSHCQIAHKQCGEVPRNGYQSWARCDLLDRMRLLDIEHGIH